MRWRARLDMDAVLTQHPASSFGRYQGYFTAPYLTGGPGGEEDWRGEP